MLGNLQVREDFRQRLYETFHYDGLHRLTWATVCEDTVTHCGASAGPHALSSAGSASYAYDLNGNVTSGAGRTVTWSSYNKPVGISQGTRSSTRCVRSLAVAI